MDEAEAIIEAIRSAFEGVPRGSITIHEAEVIDAYGTEAERQDARRQDTEASWERIPDADIAQCTTALCHLDPAGWRYHLPAYMIWSLRHFRVSRSSTVDATIYTFDPDADDATLHAYKMARFNLLDGPQSHAVQQYLRFMAKNDDHADARAATAALAAFWNRF